MKPGKALVPVLVGAAVPWAVGTLVKHWWSHEPWPHAALAGVAFGILGLAGGINDVRVRARRSDADSRPSGPPPPLA
ncbi:hypothetical protein [Streptomyces sp. NPDC049040]|uniref:hypothetical protein n=1 Tax=Streptomyces sp. NPDC049040 TaxID=3365593 RepID=UPI003722D91F